MQAALSDFPDIQVSYEFDQSPYVTGAMWGVLTEGALGAVLTGLMVLLFLRDWRSVIVVVLNIPFALLGSVVALWLTGQTINMMTLGGLALAVGILVDEATVEVENIHTQFEHTPNIATAVRLGNAQTAVPRLLAMLCILAVFLPAFFMEGAARALFVPLALAVGFAMVASYLLSSTFVPVLSVWLLARHHPPPDRPDWVERLRDRLTRGLRTLVPRGGLVVLVYAIATIGLVAGVGLSLGREIFPSGGAHAFQLRLRAPAGTNFEATERLAGEVRDEIKQTAGPSNVAITLGYVGVQPSSYPINTIFLWTGGSHEGVLQVALTPGGLIRLSDLEERLRQRFQKRFPEATFSFEPGDIVGRIMNFGAPTPVEVAIAGPDFAATRTFATKLKDCLAAIPSLRDLEIEQALDYPSVQIDVDRERAGQLGVTMDEVGRSFAAATSSSRFVAPNYWADPRTGIAFQVQVEIPQPRMSSLDDLRVVPVGAGSGRPLLGDVASIENGSVVGEYDRFNGQRMITLSANVVGEDLGRAASDIDRAIADAGAPPRGATVTVRGQIAPMRQTLTSVAIGLAVAIVVIFLLLAATFQSLRLALTVMSTVPAVLAGVVLVLLITRTTLNIQSFMGGIMAIGVAVANAILLVTFAEESRRAGRSAPEAAIEAARVRMRPVLMTSAAMIAWMIPMALAIGEGADATAPLGRAVIGGLAVATLATLAIVPSAFALTQRLAPVTSRSMDPDDPESVYKA
jgi:multidrug efflux pump subunit AcrB